MIAPGLPDSLYSNGIFVGDVVSEGVAAHCAADALGELEVFDGYGDAVQRTEVVAAGYGCFRLCGGLPCEVCGDGEIGVELRVKGVDAVQEEVDELSGGDLFGCDHVPDFPGWCECEIGGVHGAPPVGWGELSVKLVWGMVTRGGEGIEREANAGTKFDCFSGKKFCASRSLRTLGRRSASKSMLSKVSYGEGRSRVSRPLGGVILGGGFQSMEP